MKIGLFAVNYGTCGDPPSAVRIAQAAEAAGLESVWTGEHIVLPDPSLPSFPLAPDTPMLDTIVALTWIAAHTKRVRIASGIIVLPLRNPLLLAKELVTLDVVSGGRLIIGVGAGWMDAEFKALGVPMEKRGERMDDALRAAGDLDHGAPRIPRPVDILWRRCCAPPSAPAPHATDCDRRRKSVCVTSRRHHG